MKIEGAQAFTGMLMPDKINKEKNVNQSGFEKLLDTVSGLDERQKFANKKVEDVLLGKSDDTHGALIALEKAELEMQLATVVRDKFTQGYQQIMNMQI